MGLGNQIGAPGIAFEQPITMLVRITPSAIHSSEDFQDATSPETSVVCVVKGVVRESIRFG